MPVAFYASLAASASIFIGILTALLISNLNNTKAELTQIEFRIKAINARLQSLSARKDAQGEMFGRTTDILHQIHPLKRGESSAALSLQEQSGHFLSQELVTKSEMSSLKTEGEMLLAHGESLDPSRIISILNICVITTICSVIIPSIGVLLHVLNISLSITSLLVEVVGVFILWLLGLGCVFCYLHYEIANMAVDLPDLSDIEIDESFESRKPESEESE